MPEQRQADVVWLPDKQNITAPVEKIDKHLNERDTRNHKPLGNTKVRVFGYGGFHESPDLDALVEKMQAISEFDSDIFATVTKEGTDFTSTKAHDYKNSNSEEDTKMDPKSYTDSKMETVFAKIEGLTNTLDAKIEGLSGKLDARMDSLSNQLRTEVGVVQSELAPCSQVLS